MPHRTFGGRGAIPVESAHAACAFDLEPEIVSAAGAMEGLTRDYFVRLTLAVSPGSMVRVDRAMLGDVLRSVLSSAICSAFGGRVMVTAAKFGNEVHIRIIDDAADAGPTGRGELLRDQAAMIASQHGSIDVDRVMGLGTALTIRLPASVQRPDYAFPYRNPPTALANRELQPGFPVRSRCGRPDRHSDCSP
jgi:signal transduction histidine kinase